LADDKKTESPLKRQQQLLGGLIARILSAATNYAESFSLTLSKQAGRTTPSFEGFVPL